MNIQQNYQDSDINFYYNPYCLCSQNILIKLSRYTDIRKIAVSRDTTLPNDVKKLPCVESYNREGIRKVRSGQRNVFDYINSYIDRHPYNLQVIQPIRQYRPPIRQYTQPTLYINRQNTQNTQNITTDCPICYDTMKDDNSSTMNCSHSFHTACIDRWLEESDTCPMCRAYI